MKEIYLIGKLSNLILYINDQKLVNGVVNSELSM